MATKTDATKTSEFYNACRDGNVEFVENYLKTHSSTINDLNNLEPIVNSTPLHAASYYHHKEIVQLLIDSGCDRSHLNKFGLTAYEEAANDEIRQLFHRPTGVSGTRHFEEENINECFDVIKQPEKQSEKAAAPGVPSQIKQKKASSVQTYMTKAEKHLEIGHATTSIALCQSKFGRFLADKLQRDAPMSLKTMGDRLQDIIDKELIANNDPQSQKAVELLKKFLNDDRGKSIERLLRLYTLETRFFPALKQNPMPLALPLFMAVDTLKERYFKGQSYRGTHMTDDEINIYKSVAKSRENLLQIKHFTSTSTKLSIAEQFADTPSQKSKVIRPNRVLLIFTFPHHCEQAISLIRISDMHPCLSEYENEDEVLILPWTLFHVEYVHEKSTSSYDIYLSNTELPQKTLLSSLKWIALHPISCIQRFHEYFPEKQPETAVKLVAEKMFPFDKDILKQKD